MTSSSASATVISFQDAVSSPEAYLKIAQDRFSLMLKALCDRERLGMTNRSAAAVNFKESAEVLENLTSAGLDINTDAAYQALGLDGIDDYYRIEHAPDMRMALDKLASFYRQVENDKDLTGIFQCDDTHRHRYYPILAQIASHLQPTSQLAASNVPLPAQTNHINELLLNLRYDAHQLTLRIAKAEIGQEELLSWIEDAGEYIYDIAYKPTDRLRQTYSNGRYGFLDLKIA